MRSRKLALVIAPFLLLSLLPSVVSAGGPSPQAQSRAEVLKYWTPERMKSAKWLDVEVDKASGEGKLVPRAGATIGQSGGSFWPASATDDVTRGTGRVYFAFGRSAYICSGSVVTDGRTGFSVVLTAAHCEEGDRVCVTFDPVYTFRSKLYCGTWYAYPGYYGGEDNPLDVAVIVLDHPVKTIEPATLVPAGYLDELKASGDLNQSTGLAPAHQHAATRCGS